MESQPPHAADAAETADTAESAETAVTAQTSDTADAAALGRDLGRRLASLRQAAGLTQHQLAELVGYSRGTLSSAESGRFDQARRFWQRIDEMLDGQGRLVGRYDDIRYRIAAQREQQALAHRQRQRRRAWPAAAPTGRPLPGSASDVHVWYTTAEGITHCVIIPRSRVSPEQVIETLTKMLEDEDQLPPGRPGPALSAPRWQPADTVLTRDGAREAPSCPHRIG